MPEEQYEFIEQFRQLVEVCKGSQEYIQSVEEQKNKNGKKIAGELLTSLRKFKSI